MECFPPSNGAEHHENHEHKQFISFIRGGFPSPPTTESCCEILLKSYCDRVQNSYERICLHYTGFTAN